MNFKIYLLLKIMLSLENTSNMKTRLTKEVTHTESLKNKPGWSHLAANPVTPTIVSAVSNVVHRYTAVIPKWYPG